MKAKVFPTSLLVVLSVSACMVATAQTLFDDFDTNPISTRFTVHGPNTSEDSEGAPVPTFAWQDGAIVANYHSEQPVTRLEASLPVTVDETNKFRFGATFTIQSDGLFLNDAESFGFQFATFALIDSSLTGTDRFSNAFSLVEFDYFPQDSPWFDTISLAPVVIAGKTTQDNFFSRVFFDFGPHTTLNDEIGAGLLSARGVPFNTPLLAVIEYDGTSPTNPTVTITVSVVDGGNPDPLPVGVPIFDLSTAPFTDFGTFFDGFSCDTFAIVNYNESAVWQTEPSHIGTVVFDSVFFELDDPTGDADSDGLSNQMEEMLGTDPNDPDSDNDGANDGDDAFPLNPRGQTNADGDNLGDEFEQIIVDAFEEYNSMEDVGPQDDPDGDGTSNLREFLLGTDPTDPESRVPLGGAVPLVSACALLAAGLMAQKRRRTG